MSAIKNSEAPRAPRGLPYEIEPYELKAPNISEKLEAFRMIAANIDDESDASAPESLQKMMDVDAGLVSSYKSILYEETMNSLVTAELKIMELESLVQALSQPKGRGHRRSPKPSTAKRLFREVAKKQWIAKLDDKNLSQIQAVKLALQTIYAKDSRGVDLPKDQLESLVQSRLESALRTYRRAKAASKPDK